MSKVRCAIYTRKSSEEGLDQEFNSLDAQYESCKSYIASQKHEGWTVIRERYDDGGFSGGSMERPGLKALLTDVAAGKIDVVVIYKIDRLTRSLADFARIVELLEKHGASFVSVTQSFNTKTSMGRLMLHVLLSFAQFEREVGAERVRDKIAASKAKGMWMGGTVPLGYDAVERKLVVNEPEAEIVRALFAKFAEIGSVQVTLRWSQQQGMRTKQRKRLGKAIGGVPFHYGALRCVLGNCTYAGDIAHKEKIHPGLHQAIISRELFDQTQAILGALSTDAMRRPKLVSASLLQGLIVDRHDRTMGPTHSRRNGQRFRYYVTHPKCIAKGGPSAYRIAAEGIERHCLNLLAEHHAGAVRSVEDDADTQQLLALLTNGTELERRKLLLQHVCKVVVGDAKLTLELIDGQLLHRSLDRVRHGNDVKLVVGELATEEKPRSNPQLLSLLQEAQRARALALSKPQLPLDRLAAKFGLSPDRYKRLVRLSYLSPSIVTVLLENRAPAHLTSASLRQLEGLPLSWAEQDQMLLV